MTRYFFTILSVITHAPSLYYTNFLPWNLIMTSYSSFCSEDLSSRLYLPQLVISAVAVAVKSLQSCPTLCDPIDSSPPGSLSLGFSRQEHWSGLPFPSPMHESEKWKWCRSVMSDPQRPHGLQPSSNFCNLSNHTMVCDTVGKQIVFFQFRVIFY